MIFLETELKEVGEKLYPLFLGLTPIPTKHHVNIELLMPV
jgi:hypothetical protein